MSNFSSSGAKHTLKFYADLQGVYANKLFVFDSMNEEYLEFIIAKFAKHGNKFRAVFLIDNFQKITERLSDLYIKGVVERCQLYFQKSVKPDPKETFLKFIPIGERF